MIKPFDIKNVFYLNFKEDFKKNEKKFNKAYKQLSKDVKILPERYNHNTIFKYFGLYYTLLTYQLAKMYYNETDNLFLFGINVYVPFENVLINNFKFNKYLLEYYDKLYNIFNRFNLRIFRLNVVKELYKQLNKFPEAAKAFKKVENYDNDNIDNVFAVNLHIDYLYEKVCPKLGKKFKYLCNVGPPWFLYLKSKTLQHDFYVKINEKYYELFNLLYLVNKHENVCPIKSLINNNDLSQIRSDLEIYIEEDCKVKYTAQNMNRLKIDNFMIMYNKKLKNFISNCINKFIIINVGITQQHNGHANILIYNPNTNEVEIFDPQFDITNKIHKQLDIIYKKIIKLLFPKNVKYVPQHEYLIKDIQTHQENERKALLKKGFCMSWVLWYADQRLKYPNLDAKEALKKIINKNLNKNKTNQITKYTDYILKQRKTVINESDIDKSIKKLLIKYWKLK